MDFMKVLDQTVRELKREVNLKVLKVPEIEQKVLDATSNEAWGPHGSALSEIAQATKKISDCQIIMNVLWARLTDTSSNWRHVYKALAVIEYLVANGSEQAVDDIIEHTFRVSSISGFEFVEPNGKDVGINVRKKVETILSLLNDKEKIQAVRDKAAANRDKYFGLSSTGITYKSSSTSFGSSTFHHNDRYGGLGSTKEDVSFKNSYKDRERHAEETDWNHGKKDERSKSRESSGNENERRKSKKGMTEDVSKQESKSSRPSTKLGPDTSSKSSNAQSNNYDDDFDDFDPRGSSTAGSTGTNSNKVDLFGQSLVGDLMDAPPSILTETTGPNTAVPHEVDLFADATFVSAPPHAEPSGGSHSKGNIDLFATQPVFPAAFTSTVDLFGGSHSSSPSHKKAPEPENTNSFDPFAAIPLNSFEGSDVFTDFTSHTGPVTAEPSEITANSSDNDLNQLSKNFGNNNLNDLNQASTTAYKAAPKKDTFQVKSGIWADSLSRGLIDLNIAAPKQASLADIGIVGGPDEKEKGGLAPTYYMGRAMGAGSGMGKSGIGGNGNFGSFK